MLDVMDILERADIIAETGKIPPPPGGDPAEARMAKGVFACLKAPDSQECKTFHPEDMSKTHPPLWLRCLVVRQVMHEDPGLATVVNDSWDFEQAFKLAGMMLLQDTTPFISSKGPLRNKLLSMTGLTCSLQVGLGIVAISGTNGGWHRRKMIRAAPCLEKVDGLLSFAELAWGLSSCSCSRPAPFTSGAVGACHAVVTIRATIVLHRVGGTFSL